MQARQAEDMEKEKGQSNAHRSNYNPKALQIDAIKKSAQHHQNASQCCGCPSHSHMQCLERSLLCKLKKKILSLCESLLLPETEAKSQLHLLEFCLGEGQVFISESHQRNYKVGSRAEIPATLDDFPRLLVKLEKVDTVHTGPGGQLLPMLSCYTAQLHWCGKISSRRLFIIKPLSFRLLRLSAIQPLGAIKLLGEVQEPEASLHAFHELCTLKEEYRICLKPDTAPFSLSVAFPFHYVSSTSSRELE